MADQDKVVQVIVEQIKDVSSIVGAYLSGSLVNEDRDVFSDVDLGIVSKNSLQAFRAAWSLRHRIITSIGEPLHFIERGWEHCRMVAALYGKSQFPPVGLEVDAIFSQMRYVAEQMPYAKYQVVFDREGRLRQALDGLSLTRPEDETRLELLQVLRAFPFVTHDAVKAVERGDFCNAQGLFEEMRKAIFTLAAVRSGDIAYGTKRAFRYLSEAECQIVMDSYHASTREFILKLVSVLTRCLAAVQTRYSIEQDVELLRYRIAELL